MADPTPAAPQEADKTKPDPLKYTMKFDHVGEFTEAELFIRNRVAGKIWLTERMSVTLRSLIGREVDAIHEAIKVGPDMTSMHYQTEVTYRNLAYSLQKIGDEPFVGTLEEKLVKIRDMSATILLKLSLAYAEFSDHVADLFVGKEAGALAKKS
jgi:hypothetical protein